MMLISAANEDIRGLPVKLHRCYEGPVTIGTLEKGEEILTKCDVFSG